MRRAMFLRDEPLYRESNKLAGPIAEKPLRLSISKHDSTSLIDRQDTVRRCLKQATNERVCRGRV